MLQRNPSCGCGDDAICNATELNCDPCCRCIPLRLCATFAESDGCYCKGTTDLLEIDGNHEYIGSVGCGSEYMDLLVFLHYAEGVCYWRVISESHYIDELFEIGPELQSCDKPVLAFPVDLGTCSGIVTIQRHEQALLPFRDEPDCNEPWCGNCECTCTALCVKISKHCIICGEGEIGYDENLSTYATDPSWSGYIVCSGESYSLHIVLSRDEYTGDCLLGGSADGETLQWQWVSDCTALSASWVLYDGTIISVECAVCRCDTMDCKVGCCFGVDYSQPLYPCGVVPAIPFSVSAPGCDIDGQHGVFFAGGTAPVTAMGTCGPACHHISGYDIGSTIGKRVATGMGYVCLYTPCSIPIELRLECEDGSASPYGLNSCCGKLRLVVITSEKLVGGDTGTPPGNIPPGGHWLKIAPTSCECLPNGGGVAAIFKVNLVVECPEHWQSGVCYGEPKDCCIPFCGGFTLTI